MSGTIGFDRARRPVVARILGPTLAEVAAFARTLSQRPGDVIAWDQDAEVRVKCPDPAQAEAMAARFGDSLYSLADLPLEHVVGTLLAASGRTIAVAESCTGGLVCERATRVSGASAWFLAGFVTYSNEAKEKILGVPRELMIQHGAVSGPVVEAMAEGARQAAGADYGVAVSGVAGPGGGTPEKPVGTVWIGHASKAEQGSRVFRFEGDRERIRMAASAWALDAVRRLCLVSR
jgi:PncC family amidohydrolase